MFQAEQLVQNRYQLHRMLGENAGRQTWLATDLQAIADDRAVVVKFLLFGGSTHWDDLKLFEREAMILQQLNHPRIPKYRDSFNVEVPLPWMALVQSYIPGKSLKQQLDDGRHFSELELETIARAVLKILVYLHGLNPPVLHRDIKPSNIILGTDDRIYLVDFGAVQDRAAMEGATFTVVGTYGYAPMEQFGGRTVPASDLYALGATIVNLATGVPPGDLFGEDGRLHIRDRLTLCPDLVDWLCRMTAPLVGDRFPTAQAAIDALENPPHPAPTVAPVADPPRSSAASIAPTRPRSPALVQVWDEPGRYRVEKSPDRLTISFPPGGIIRWLFGRPDDDPQSLTSTELRQLVMGTAGLVIFVPLLICFLAISWAPFLYGLAGGCVLALLLALNVGNAQQLVFDRTQFCIIYQCFNWVYQAKPDVTDAIGGVFFSQRRSKHSTTNELCIRLHNGSLYRFSSSRLQETDYHWMIQTINTWLYQD